MPTGQQPAQPMQPPSYSEATVGQPSSIPQPGQAQTTLPLQAATEPYNPMYKEPM